MPSYEWIAAEGRWLPIRRADPAAPSDLPTPFLAPGDVVWIPTLAQWPPFPPDFAARCARASALIEEYGEEAFHRRLSMSQCGDQRRIERIVATHFTGSEPWSITVGYTDGGHHWRRPLEEFRGAPLALGRAIHPSLRQGARHG